MNVFSFSAVTASAVFGFSVVYTGADIATETSISSPVINVRSIEIYDDGSVYYDRSTEDGEIITWSGQMFRHDGSLECSGFGQVPYYNDENPLDTKDIHWMISPDCNPKSGMTWAFQWFPANPALDPVRYPETGFGVVASAK